MRKSSLKFLFLWSRIVVGFFLLSAFAFSCQLVALTLEIPVGNNTEVRLCLDTQSPNLFSAVHEAKAGFEDGTHSRSHRPRQPPMPRMQANISDFELAADPQTPVLRYHESSPWKRLALLLLGASDNLYSLSLILFVSIGSWQLWRLLLDVTPATPFTLANSRRLAKLALLVLSLGLTQTVSYMAIRALVPIFHAPGLVEPLSHYVHLNTENTLPSYLVGIMLAVISAVYRRGVELSQEAELII